jgi:hypothetical protein
LSPLATATRPQLVNEINRLASVRSIHGKIDLQFEDTSFAEAGLADKYRQADGSITMQRPGKVYLVIQFAFVDIAQMASDGQRFQVAVLRGDEKYKRFVKGTNNAVYPKLGDERSDPPTKKGKSSGEKETVSALSNLRPQHLTDAFMIKPVVTNDGFIYAQSEFFQEERDTRPQAKKSSCVVRGYYLLEEFSQPNNGESRLTRRFWFDRVNGIRLARLQTYDDEGRLITDVSYLGEKAFGESGQYRLPSRIEITRPQDKYKLSISYQDPAAVNIGKEWPEKAFVLENSWQLQEVDLDSRQEKKATNNR